MLCPYECQRLIETFQFLGTPDQFVKYNVGGAKPNQFYRSSPILNITHASRGQDSQPRNLQAFLAQC